MKLLIIAYYYPPINSGGTARPAKMARYLPEFGHHVTVLTQSYTETDFAAPGVIRIRDISCNKDRGTLVKRIQWLGLRLISEALNVIGVHHSIYSWWKNNTIKYSDEIMAKAKPDVIIATYPPVETLEIGLFLSRKYNVPLISDFRDGLMFEPIETKRMNRYRCIRRRYAAIEKDALHQSVAVTTIADPITEYYRDTFSMKHALSLSNGYDPEDFIDLPPVQLEDGCFHIVFTGRFGLSDKYNRVDYFFDAVRLLLRQEDDSKEEAGLKNILRIHLVGEFRQEEFIDLRDLIDTGVIVVHGFVEKRNALAFQMAADVLLIITPPDRRSATSTKIFEYLHSGKPVLALTYKTVLEDIIKETGAGWLVHPHKPEEIAALLSRIITDKDFYNALTPDQEKIQHYSVKSQLEKLHHLLETIN